jgi:hypothetical protein
MATGSGENSHTDDSQVVGKTIKSCGQLSEKSGHLRLQVIDCMAPAEWPNNCHETGWNRIGVVKGEQHEAHTCPAPVGWIARGCRYIIELVRLEPKL